jgi:hypothetical protein
MVRPISNHPGELTLSPLIRFHKQGVSCRIHDRTIQVDIFSFHHLQLVPLQYRLLVINGVNIPWNAFLSLQNAKSKKT